MARWEFTLPDIGEGVTEGEIVGWLIRPGDSVKEDQPMVEVMTDKATVTITAPKAGFIVETRGRVGEVVAVHSVLVVFELEGGAADPLRAARTNGRTQEDGPPATAVGDIKETLPGIHKPQGKGASGGERPPPASSGGAGLGGYFNEKPLATPATRKLARDKHVDLRHVPPTGPQGRVTQQDVESFASTPPSTHEQLAPAPPAAHVERHEPSPAALVSRAVVDDERVPLAGLRRKIAQKMAQSKRTAAHFTFVEECEVTSLKEVRERLVGHAETFGVKLTFLPFIVKAVVASLRKHPMLNASLDETANEIVLHKHYNIGVATATPAGLIVPVVKEADRRSLLEIAREIDRLANDARAGKAKLEDLHGSTFTITSLGAQGGLFATPIVNFPEVAILGVHRMKERPVVKEGQIAIGEVMLLSLSFDHRVVDGHVGAAFAYEVIGYLEHPERLLLEMA
jgi:pyruvate dehydrogenase E2 component (dihydrolipoamide acetyltransferase)